MIRYNIAIDGPAGAGKSTIAKRLAGILGYIYIDTGAMYRAVTLKALRSGVQLDNQTELTRLTQNTAIQLQIDPGGTQLVLLDGENVTQEIRSPEVTGSVSLVSAVAGVRLQMVHLQQNMAANGGVVMDGRDIGTYVLPQANFKFYLTASIEERARRRFLELTEKGEKVDIEQLTREIEQRDAADASREFAPLVQAPDAFLIDSSSMTIPQVVDCMLNEIRGGQ